LTRIIIINLAPLVGFLADYSKRLFRYFNPNLTENVSSLRANSLCLFLCSIFGFFSGIIPCIGTESIILTFIITTTVCYIELIIDKIPIQSLSVLSICIFRSFYVGTTAMFISYAFPVEHFGKLYGITRVIGGLFTLLAAPIFDVVLEQGNKFKNANFDFAVVIALCMFHPINVWLLSTKEQEIHDKEQEQIDQVKNLQSTRYPAATHSLLRSSKFQESGPIHVRTGSSRHLNSSVVLNSLQSIAA
jgi:hypothetical protein